MAWVKEKVMLWCRLTGSWYLAVEYRLFSLLLQNFCAEAEAALSLIAAMSIRINRETLDILDQKIIGYFSLPYVD